MSAARDPDPAPPKGDAREGVLAAGNFIVDFVKVIDAFPEQDMLVNILAESRSNGGGPYNVLKDLARLGAPFPLAAAGLVGDDEPGDWIVADCAAHGIDTSLLRRAAGVPTSYTDAMTVESTGRRTFFHQRGANARFSPDDVDLASSRARFFYLGYLMLLDTLDALDAGGRSSLAAELLGRASAEGFVTCVDLVSIAHPEFRQRVLPALAHTDYLFLNEREASLVTGREIVALDEFGPGAAEILGYGVRRGVVLHSAEGAVAAEAGGACHRQESLALPDGFIRGATGAGDAFVAGCLFELHAGRPMPEALRAGVHVAAASLSDPTPSGGVGPMAECLRLGSPKD